LWQTQAARRRGTAAGKSLSGGKDTQAEKSIIYQNPAVGARDGATTPETDMLLYKFYQL
jgi:hypothetical protein